MKSILLVILLSLMLTGCAPRHYINDLHFISIKMVDYQQQPQLSAKRKRHEEWTKVIHDPYQVFIESLEQGIPFQKYFETMEKMDPMQQIHSRLHMINSDMPQRPANQPVTQQDFTVFYQQKAILNALKQRKPSCPIMKVEFSSDINLSALIYHDKLTLFVPSPSVTTCTSPVQRLHPEEAIYWQDQPINKRFLYDMPHQGPYHYTIFFAPINHGRQVNLLKNPDDVCIDLYTFSGFLGPSLLTNTFKIPKKAIQQALKKSHWNLQANYPQCPSRL